MAVLLNRAYQGYTAGSVVELPAETEAALIAQGLAQNSSAALTTGAVTPSNTSLTPVSGFAGAASIAAAGTSVVITNAAITANSKAFAQIDQATTDGTALYVTRVLCAAGSLTIVLNAAATAAVTLNYLVVN